MVHGTTVVLDGRNNVRHGIRTKGVSRGIKHKLGMM